ncbi:MAG: ABC transporter ATP-binding protein [Armatimonadota bacterium]
MLKCNDICLDYVEASRVTHALKGITLDFAPNKLHGIMGPSGSGKSSLLYILCGLKSPSSGSVSIDDQSMTKMPDSERASLRSERFGFVFQQPFLLHYLSALENILVGVSPSKMTMAKKKAEALLCDLGLDGMGDKYPSMLSGGERQRVAVARALIGNPSIVFADEPTAALDKENGYKVMQALTKWAVNHTVIVVTHDADMLRDADVVHHLMSGCLVDNPHTNVR